MLGGVQITDKYVLITLCKNEGENLPSLIESIVDQTIRPIVWVIVNDGSTDDTPFIIAKSCKKYQWIQSLNISELKKRDIGLNYADLLKRGFDKAIEYCNNNAIEFEYLGNVDGDLTLENTFFENLILQFSIDQKLGIASGGTDYKVGNKILRVKTPINEPSGGHMLIRKKCFDECGGIPITYAVDSVLKAKARLRGWKTKRFEENRAFEIRDVSSAEGYWQGYIMKGKTSYYINMNPVHVFAKSFKFLFRYPHYIGFPYLIGFTSSFLSHEKQIEDLEIKNYFNQKWKIRVKQMIGKK